MINHDCPNPGKPTVIPRSTTTISLETGGLSSRLETTFTIPHAEAMLDVITDYLSGQTGLSARQTYK
ncbi:MAG: hypothetical protein ACJAWP_001252 [Porticoccus sp.]|jgi:hypothetical protein